MRLPDLRVLAIALILGGTPASWAAGPAATSAAGMQPQPQPSSAQAAQAGTPVDPVQQFSEWYGEYKGDSKPSRPMTRSELAEREAAVSSMLVHPGSDDVPYQVAVDRMMTKPTDELFDFAAYKDRRAVENLGTGLKLGASEARMATVETGAPFKEVISFYLERLYSRQIVPRVQQIYANAVYITYIEADGFMRVMTLVADADQTTVIAAVADPDKVYRGVLGLENTQADDAFADWQDPNPESYSLNLVTGGKTGTNMTRQMEIKGASVDEVQERYLKLLEKNGWNVAGSEKFESGVLFSVFEKDGKSCSLALESDSKRKGYVIASVACQKVMNSGLKDVTDFSE